MDDFEARSRELGLHLDVAPAPPGKYVGATCIGTRCLSAGHLPFVDGALPAVGKVGDGLSVATAAESARIAAANCLASIRSIIHSLDRIDRIVAVHGYVYADADFQEHHLVTNGASGLMLDIFGDAGRHVRTSVGVSGLPFHAPVEVSIECLLLLPSR